MSDRMCPDDISISYLLKILTCDYSYLLKILIFNRNLEPLRHWLAGNKLSLNAINAQSMAISTRPKIKEISDKAAQPL